MAEVKKETGRAEKAKTELSCNGRTKADVLSKVRDYIHNGYAPNEALVIVCGFSWEAEHDGQIVTLRLLDDEGKVLAKNCFRSESTADGVDGCIRLMFGIPFSTCAAPAVAESAPEQTAKPEPVPVPVPMVPPTVETQPVMNVLVPPMEPPVAEKKGDPILKTFTDYVILQEELNSLKKNGAVIGVGGMVSCHGKRIPMRCWKSSFKGNFEWLVSNWKPYDGKNQIAFRVNLIEHDGSEQFELLSFANQ